MALTEWKDLLERLERDPENEILAAMLTDELIEARRMQWSEATRYVTTARKVARDALDLECVVATIRADGPRYVYLCERIRRTLGQCADARFVLFLTCGDGRPRLGVGTDLLGAEDPGPGLYVTLPCTWARRELDNSALPLHWPRSPRRVAKLMRRPAPLYRVIGR